MAIQVGDTCKNGHVIEGDNIQNYLNRGNPHIRCKTCNRTPVPKKNIGDLCKKGHVIEGDNVIVRKMRGSYSYTCRECSLNASRRYRKSDKFLNNPKYVKNRQHAEKVRLEISQGLRGRAGVSWATIMKRAEDIDKRILQNPHHPNIIPNLATLDLDKRGKDALNTLMLKMDNNEPFCYDNPAVYVDYEEANEPSMYEAYKMCVGCPLLVECARFASASGPEQGVWGGEVWKQGRAKKND
jgi:hypothetical protein